MTTPTFDQNVQITAAKLRGAYLEMSADIEFLLVDIIGVCLLRNERERNLIKEMLLSSHMLSKKIDYAASALKVYNENYYTLSKPYLQKFKEFGEMRNKLSHNRIIGDKMQKTLEVIYFTKFIDGELKDIPINVRETYEKLKIYAEAIHDLGVSLIPRIYQERYYSRYNNVLEFPSNRSKSYWHHYFQGTNQSQD